MATVRVFPPSSPAPGAAASTTTVNGRTYSSVPGAYTDVPDFDARMLAANGWLQVAQVGPTSARPVHNVNVTGDMPKGLRFIDTTLGIEIIWDGATWRNPVTNAAV